MLFRVVHLDGSRAKGDRERFDSLRRNWGTNSVRFYTLKQLKKCWRSRLPRAQIREGENLFPRQCALDISRKNGESRHTSCASA